MRLAYRRYSCAKARRSAALTAMSSARSVVSSAVARSKLCTFMVSGSPACLNGYCAIAPRIGSRPGTFFREGWLVADETGGPVTQLLVRFQAGDRGALER